MIEGELYYQVENSLIKFDKFEDALAQAISPKAQAISLFKVLKPTLNFFIHPQFVIEVSEEVLFKSVDKKSMTEERQAQLQNTITEALEKIVIDELISVQILMLRPQLDFPTNQTLDLIKET